jgi:hypothetical protein
MGGFETKGCSFQHGPMGVNNLPFKKDFSTEIDLLHEKVKWWMNWS